MILGAGFGGLELSARLAEDLADDVRVTLIDQNDSFIFGFAKLDVMFGRRSRDEVRLFYRDIAKPNVQFRQETVLSIDPQARRVRTDRATYDADILVVALGADLDPGATPGLVEGGHEFYSPQGAERVANVLPSFKAGVAVIGVLGPFFKCPPAPNEAALMLHDYLSERGVRDAVTIYLVNPLGSPIPVSEETSAAIVSMLAERDIEHWPSSQVERLDPAAKVAHLADGRRLPYDLFLAVPVHRAPAVVLDAGLTEDGWIPGGPGNLRDPVPRRLCGRRRHQRSRPPRWHHRRRRGSDTRRRTGRQAQGEVPTAAVQRSGGLLHRDRRRNRRQGRRRLPVGSGAHRSVHTPVRRSRRGETALRISPCTAVVQRLKTTCGRPSRRTTCPPLLHRRAGRVVGHLLRRL